MDQRWNLIEWDQMPVIKVGKASRVNAAALADMLRDFDAGEAYVEQVGAMPGQGVSSMFRFGATVGAIHMAVAARGHSLRLVTPAKWKAHFRLARDKGVARGLAARRFPTNAKDFARVRDDGRAEASLIALYGHEVTR